LPGSVSREIFRVRVAPLVDLELLADAAHELVQRASWKRCIGSTTEERSRRVMSETPVERHGVAAVDRHHHDVEPADRGKMAFVELVMQMSEMADAQARNLEDEIELPSLIISPLESSL